MKRTALVFLLLAGCAAEPQRPEPEIRTVEVKVMVPQPCRALAAMSEEPAMPDTDEALKAAPGLFDRVKLLLQGREIRSARLEQYKAAKASCL